jgi:drug/metabolite transporter, DME family
MTESSSLPAKSDPAIRKSPQHQPGSLPGFVYIGTAAFFWGLSASLGRAAFTGRLRPWVGIHSVNPLILSQGRTTFAFLAVAFGLWARRGFRPLQVPVLDFTKLFLLGLGGVAASNYFYYLAIERTNVATAIIVQYTAPVWVLLYMVGRGKERLSFPRIGSVVLAILGIALVIGLLGRGRLHLDLIGVAAALGAAVSFSYYNIGGHTMLARYDRWVVLLYTSFSASLFWVVINPPNKIAAAHYSAYTWIFLALFSLFSVLLPFPFYFAGLERLVPTQAIVASCLEPVFSILIAAFALKEVVGPLQAVGILMVLSAIVLAERRSANHEPIAGPVD